MKKYLKENTVNNIYVRHAIDYKPDDHDFHMHIHDKCEIFYFVSGKVECLVEGSRYPLEHGSLVIMRPAESHRIKILRDKPYERYAINFPLSAADSIDPDRALMTPFLDRSLGIGNMYYLSEFDGIAIENHFKRLCNCSDKYISVLEIQLSLFFMLDLVRTSTLRRKGNEHAVSQSRSGQILAYINEHLFDKLSVPMLAEHFFISTSQLTRLFKSATGSSPWEYITLKRLTVAKEKIRSGTPATKACVDCGFDDYSVFYRAYVKHFGCSPKNDDL